jgi:general secretion pathway protein A
MYLNFFKFKKSPFNITPDPDFLFMSPSHKEASASIFYGIEERKGFVAVTGEVGVGKTTILRTYLEETDPEKVRIVYVFNATISFDALLKHIVSELGITVVDNTPSELVDSLFRHLINEYKSDRNIVLIIDEAQNIPVETLERLRMLSNLETSQDKLLQIVLVGQPEFEDKLNLPELRQLRQRIAIRSHIEALTTDESFAYIQHRLMRASQFHNQVFTKGAMKRIVKQAKGIPRVINVLCDNSLITGFGYQRNPVDEKIVKEVIRDFQGRQHRISFKRKIALVFLLVLIGSFGIASRSIVSQEETPAARPEILTTQPPSSVPERAEQRNRPDSAAVKTGVTDETNQHVLGAEAAPAASESAEGRVESPAPAEAKNQIPELLEKRAWSNAATPFDEPPQTGSDKTSAAVQPSVKQQSDVITEEGPPEKPVPVHVVRRGESVGQLIMDANGRLDDELFKTFLKINPRITNINKIKEGEKVVLPKVRNK